MVAAEIRQNLSTKRKVRILKSLRELSELITLSSAIEVPYSSLEFARENETIPMGRGLYARFNRLPSGLFYQLRMNTGSSSGAISHPDCMSLVYVASGRITDRKTGIRYGRGGTFVIPSGTEYDLLAKEVSLVNIQYVKRNDREQKTKPLE